MSRTEKTGQNCLWRILSTHLLRKPYNKDELALLSHLAVIYGESITPASEDENPEAEADDDDDDDDDDF